MELTLQAVARCAIDLYAMTAMVIRTRDLVAQAEARLLPDLAAGPITLTKYFFHEAASRLALNLQIIREGGIPDLTAAAAQS
jgi:hypothetical protein